MNERLPEVRAAELQGVLDTVRGVDQSEWTPQQLATLRNTSRIIAQRLSRYPLSVNGRTYRGIDTHREVNNDLITNWDLIVDVIAVVPSKKLLWWDTKPARMYQRHSVTSQLQRGLVPEDRSEVLNFLHDAFDLCRAKSAFAVPEAPAAPAALIPKQERVVIDRQPSSDRPAVIDLDGGMEATR